MRPGPLLGLLAAFGAPVEPYPQPHPPPAPRDPTEIARALERAEAKRQRRRLKRGSALGFVTCLHPVHGTWAQYDRGQAGWYRGGRRARRLREIAAHAAGALQVPRVLVVQRAVAAGYPIGPIGGLGAPDGLGPGPGGLP